MNSPGASLNAARIATRGRVPKSCPRFQEKAQPIRAFRLVSNDLLPAIALMHFDEYRHHVMVQLGVSLIPGPNEALPANHIQPIRRILLPKLLKRENGRLSSGDPLSQFRPHPEMRGSLEIAQKIVMHGDRRTKKTDGRLRALLGKNHR
jgi:hypothetical protein